MTTTMARYTSESLNRGSIVQIVRFLRGSARAGPDQLSEAEFERLVRCADDLETILNWQNEKETA